MTFYDCYIGDLDDPDFHWDGGDWNGNSPKGITRALPSLGREDPFDRIQDLIHTGTLVGKQTDWGCWVAIASRETLLGLINEWYGDESIYVSVLDDDDDDKEETRELHELVSKLDPKNYALVALES